MTLDDICGVLIELQTRRRHCIRQQSKTDRSTEAFLARRIGYHSGLQQAERKKLFDRAVALRRAIEKGDIPADPEVSDVAIKYASLVLRAASARQGWDEDRREIEKQMRQQASELPAIGFISDVAGFSDLGLAVIVGEAGNLDGYANPAKLWKRLGLAVLNGQRQGNPGKGASKEDWITHGYNPSRRAEVWAFTDSMFRHQWRGGQPVGKYGDMYGRKKAEYLARAWTPKHADSAARRYMSKTLVRDLWEFWNNPPPSRIDEAAE